MGRKKVQVENVAQGLLALLGERDIRYLFANAGTDFASLIEAFARSAAEGSPHPQPVLVPHENVAVAMAHGYYQLTGKPQAVMVHVTVGTANALNGIINAARDQIPILFMAGRTPLTEHGLTGSRDLYIHWAQESFDQAAMVREYVKWDYELRCGEQLEEVVDRALEIAMAEPRGPVYLTLPREVLAEKLAGLEISSPPRRHSEGRLHPDPETVQRAASLLAEARDPLIITTSSGRNPECVSQLVALAESLAVPVVTFNPRYLCFPTDHPLHLGFAPGPMLAAADVVMVLDSNVPWYPAGEGPGSGCKVIEVGIDPVYSRYPMRSFPCDLALKGDTAVTLRQLGEAVGRKMAGREGELAQRRRALEEAHRKQRAGWRETMQKGMDSAPLDPLWISHCIGRIKDRDTLVFNEYDLDPTQLDFTTPGSFFGNPSAGGLGWALGASLGAKLAAPEKTVIATVGDGSYLFGNPTPAHFVSRSMGAPTLTVIFNNSAWNAVRLATLRMYPDGWAARAKEMPLSKLEPSPDYELLVTACGGYGERVEKPGQVMPALERGLKAVREEKRSAVLNMICKTPGL